MLQLKEVCIRKFFFILIIEKLNEGFELRTKKIINEEEIDDKCFKEFDNFCNIHSSHLKISQFDTKITQSSEYFFISRKPILRRDIISNIKKTQKILTSLLKGLRTLERMDNNLSLLGSSDRGNFYYTHRNIKDYYIWQTKVEFEKFVRSIMNDTFFKDVTFLKLLKEIWVVLKIYNNSITTSYSELSIHNISLDIEERINLSFYNIGKRNYFSDDFELHKAVMDNNLRMIRKICALESTSHLYCDINEIDTHDNTPLMLAIKINNTDAINVLCDHDADVNHISFENDVSPIEYVTSRGNERILRILISSKKKQKFNFLDNNKKSLLEKIKQIPDFTLDLNLQLSSKVFFFFSSVLPSDNFKIMKKGGNVRIDMMIRSKSKGWYTILLKENGDDLNIYKIDHIKKKCYDWYEMISNVDEDDKKVKQIIEEGFTNKSYINQNLKLTEFSQTKEESILNYKCKKYNADYSVLLRKETKKKKDVSSASLKKIYKDFLTYFQEGVRLRNRLKNKNSILDDCIRTNIINSTRIIPNDKKDFSNFLKEMKDYEEPKVERNISVSIKRKNIELTVWVCESFPIQISHFLPLLNVMSISNSEFSKLKSTLFNNNLPFETFPLKISYPLAVSFYALLSVTGFSNLVPNIDMDENIYTVRDSIPKKLDENYAKDFYDKYYLERNKDNQGSILSDRSIEEARELFETKLKLMESSEDDGLNSNRSNNNSKKPQSLSNFNESEQYLSEIKLSNYSSCVNNQDNRRHKLIDIENNMISVPTVSNDSENYTNVYKNYYRNHKDLLTSTNLSQKVIWESLNDAFECEEEIPNEIVKSSFGKTINLPKNKPKIFINTKNTDNKQTLKVKFRHRYSSFIEKIKGRNEKSPKSNDSELSTINEFDDINKTSISHSPLRISNWELNKKIKSKTFKAHRNQELFRTHCV